MYRVLYDQTVKRASHTHQCPTDRKCVRTNEWMSPLFGDVTTDQRSLWSVPEMFAKLNDMTDWNLSCECKTHLLVFFYLVFAALWHVLCLEAWLGFRYIKVRVFLPSCTPARKPPLTLSLHICFHVSPPLPDRKKNQSDGVQIFS